MRHGGALIAAGGAWLLAGGVATAAVTQPPPGNEVMPRPPLTAEVSLWQSRGFPADAGTLAGLFKYHSVGGVSGADLAIDPVMDAYTTPGVFTPQCGFSARIVLRGGACRNALGWYNATTSPATRPADNQIYPLVPANLMAAPPAGISCADADFCPLATMITTQTGLHGWTSYDFAANIRMDARYVGGAVGFALIGTPGSQCTQTKFSQAELNQLSASGSPWVTALIYKSIATAAAVAGEAGRTGAARRVVRVRAARARATLVPVGALRAGAPAAAAATVGGRAGVGSLIGRSVAAAAGRGNRIRRGNKIGPSPWPSPASGRGNKIGAGEGIANRLPSPREAGRGSG